MQPKRTTWFPVWLACCMGFLLLSLPCRATVSGTLTVTGWPGGNAQWAQLTFGNSCGSSLGGDSSRTITGNGTFSYSANNAGSGSQMWWIFWNPTTSSWSSPQGCTAYSVNGTLNYAWDWSTFSGGQPSWTGYVSCATISNRTPGQAAQNWYATWVNTGGGAGNNLGYVATLGPNQSLTFCYTNTSPGSLVMTSDFTQWGTNDFINGSTATTNSIVGSSTPTPNGASGGISGGVGTNGVNNVISGTPTNNMSTNAIAAQYAVGNAIVQGLQNVVDAVNASGKGIQGSITNAGGGGGGDGVNTTNLLNKIVSELGYETNALANAQQTGTNWNSYPSGAWTGTNGDLAYAAGTNALGSVVGQANSAVTAVGTAPSVGAGSASILTFDFVGTSLTLDLDSLFGISGFCDFIKQLMGWSATVFFLFWFGTQYSQAVQTFSSAQTGGVPDLQAEVLGVGGNFLGFGAALVVPIIVVGLWVALFTYMFSQVLSVLGGSYFTTNPWGQFSSIGSPGQAALYILNRLFPMSYLMSLIWTRLILQFTMSKLALFAAAGTRFLLGR